MDGEFTLTKALHPGARRKLPKNLKRQCVLTCGSIADFPTHPVLRRNNGSLHQIVGRSQSRPRPFWVLVVEQRSGMMRFPKKGTKPAGKFDTHGARPVMRCSRSQPYSESFVP